jgi:hypothetical protein
MIKLKIIFNLKQFYKKKLQKKIKRQGLKLKGKEIEGLL